VPLRSDAYYRDLVERTLREAGVEEPPVDVGSLAAHLGVPVRGARLPGWFKGALVYEDGLPVILLNEARDEKAKRQALGHMIAHVFIMLDDPDVGFPREQPEHHHADVMADEWVLPAFLVRDQARKWFNDYRYLAGLFGVSEDEMVGRMQDMGLLKKRGIYWDY